MDLGNSGPTQTTDNRSDAERRRATRTSVFLPATIYFVEQVVEARIHNASASGFMGEADAELSIGQQIHLWLGKTAYHLATVRWITGRKFGVSLPNALALLGGKSAAWKEDDGVHDARAVRVPLDVLADLYISRPPRPGTVRNISETGLLLDSGPDLQVGQQLLVALKGRGCIHGRIQWTGGGKAGVRSAGSIADKLPRIGGSEKSHMQRC